MSLRRPGRDLVLGLFTLSLYACGGGGGGGSSSSGGDSDAASLEPKSSFSDDDATYFLARTQFGARDSELTSIKSLGMAAYVDQMIDNAGASDAALEQEALTEIEDQNFPRSEEIVRWWLHILVRTRNPFKESLALFWHDHFATSQEVLDSSSRAWMLNHVNLWRDTGTGNVRELLYKMATDWTMLVWLNGVDNVRGNPNENFAREFYELFSLGANNGYTEADIVETARAFTGFRTRYDDATQKSYVEWDEERHDLGFKTIFGVQIQGRVGPNGYVEYQDIVDNALASRDVGKWICKRLLEYFCYESPPDSVVNELAQLLKDSSWELRPVLRKLLLSKAFYSNTARSGFVKSPVEFAIGFIRATGLEVPMDELDRSLDDAGQRITMPPSVNGWPGGSMWLSEQAMIARANILRNCIYERDYQAGLGIDVAALLPPVDQRSDVNVVDQLSRLLRVRLSDEERAACVEYLNRDRIYKDSESDYTVIDPFDGSDPVQIDKKVRGLLYILGQHPSYHVR
ncbi:MAG: DUF1800 domain-containing protein [Planctomycetota bacterium]